MALSGRSDIAPRDPTLAVGGKKSDRLYNVLKRAIILRDYGPGKQILEQSLALEFRCSQSTIREALINLSKDGLVERSGYHGTHVTDTSLEEAAAMVRVRLAIERSVARSIARSGLHPDQTSAAPLLAQMDDAHAKGDHYLGCELDRQFHAGLTEDAGMGLLSPILQRCALHIHRFTLSNVEAPRSFFQEAGVGAEHRMLLETLCRGSEDHAEAAIVAHLAHVLKRWAPSVYDRVGQAAFGH